MADDRYVRIGHQKLEDDTDPRGPRFCMYIKRSKRANLVINNIDVSYNRQDEDAMMIKQFTRLPESLDQFGFAEIGMWISKTQRGDAGGEGVQNVTKISAELRKVRKMMSERPADKSLAKLESQLVDKLRQRQVEMTEKMKGDGNNPLKYATELLVLTPDDIGRLMDTYGQIDELQEGRVTIDAVSFFPSLLVWLVS